MSEPRIWSLAINSEGYIYAGTRGGVFRSVNTTVSVEEENSLPLEYTLTQNYPNPFNPETVISYQLPVMNKVILKVYDVLGREVATLVNKQQRAGYYEIDWNASNLTSGIYFYRIQAIPIGRQAGDPAKGTGQGFVDTKKMVLLR